jgi:hypothetical protein
MASFTPALTSSESTENSASATPPLSPFQNLTFPDPKPSTFPDLSRQASAEESVSRDPEDGSAKRATRTDKPSKQEPPRPSVSQVQRQLEEWNETDPIDLSPPPDFQDPLGHLTDAEQAAYLNDPPTEYLDALERRSADREEYEKLLYLSSPVQNWRLAYSVEPVYEEDGIKPWVPWTPEKRTTVMEKLRRYDERFQARYRAIYRHFDGRAARKAAQKRLLAKMEKPTPTPKEPQFVPTGKTKRERRRQREEHAQRVRAERIRAKGTPPKEVFEVMIRRDVIRSRNTALLEGQTTAFEELLRFADITEGGVIVNVLAGLVRRKKEVEKEERMREDEWKEWRKMPEEVKAEMVDWGGI